MISTLSNFGRWVFPDSLGDFNAAKSLEMTDKDYLDWKEEHGKPLPHTQKKQSGLYPCFVWGAVGCKCKLEIASPSCGSLSRT